jgi:hypothetical protein
MELVIVGYYNYVSDDIAPNNLSQSAGEETCLRSALGTVLIILPGQ